MKDALVKNVLVEILIQNHDKLFAGFPFCPSPLQYFNATSDRSSPPPPTFDSSMSASWPSLTSSFYTANNKSGSSGKPFHSPQSPHGMSSGLVEHAQSSDSLKDIMEEDENLGPRKPTPPKISGRPDHRGSLKMKPTPASREWSQSPRPSPPPTLPIKSRASIRPSAPALPAASASMPAILPALSPPEEGTIVIGRPFMQKIAEVDDDYEEIADPEDLHDPNAEMSENGIHFFLFIRTQFIRTSASEIANI